jgi:putative redox protein
MTVRLYAEKKAWPLTGVAVKVMHSKAKDRLPADVFAREITLEGPLDVEQKARLLEIAGKCPVHRTLEAGSHVETALAGSAVALAPDEDPAEHERDMERTCAEAG